MSFNPTFGYRPLPTATSIRLLLVSPGVAGERIDCHFMPCDLNADHAAFPDNPRPVESMNVATNKETGQVFVLPCDIPDLPRSALPPGSRLHPFQRYRAVSYVWGDTSELETVRLEGKDFLVTRNLMAALQAMRHPQVGVKLWVDAVCINQADAAEKKTQIPLMGRIYRQAESVWGQVLPAFDKADELRDLLVSIPTAARALEDDLRSRQHTRDNAEKEEKEKEEKEKEEKEEDTETGDKLPSLFTEYALEDYNLPPATSPLWQAWRQLFSSPFFQRIWIQQEVVLAKNFKWYLGTTMTNPRAILTCIRAMRRYSRNFNGAYLSPEGVAVPMRTVTLSASDPIARPDQCFDPKAARGIISGYLAAEKMLNERERMRNSGEPSPLIDLLSTYRSFCATEARDMVFGLLGLASDADQFYSLVDYASPLESVFARLAQRFVELGHGAKMLSQASNTEYSGQLPSWVPNWGCATGSSTASPHHYSPIDPQDFTAGGTEENAPGTVEVVQDEHKPGEPVLRVRGAIIDTIQHCSPAAQVGELVSWLQQEHDVSVPDGFLQDGSLELIVLWARAGLQFAVDNVPKERGGGTQEFLETCCQAARDFWTNDIYHSRRLGFLQFVSESFDIEVPRHHVDQLRRGFDPKDEAMPLRDFINDALNTIGLQRRFCTTERGLFGLVPSACAPGDKVFVLRGGAVPFVLRKAEEGREDDMTDERYYRLVGDAYIHSVMYGEGLAFDEVKESTILLV